MRIKKIENDPLYIDYDLFIPLSGLLFLSKSWKNCDNFFFHFNLRSAGKCRDI